MTGHPSDQVIELFQLPPDGFIAARNVLARALQDDGREDEAAAVKHLRKPTVPAWALNQLPARDPEGIGELLDAGAELRAAQRATLSSAANAGRLRTATEVRRQAVSRLARRASEILADSGRTTRTQLDEVTAALVAASIDPEAGELLRTGTFERPPTPATGLGEAFGLSSVPTDAEGETQPSGGTGVRGKGSDAIPRAEVAKLQRDRDAAVRRLAKDHELVERHGRERARLQGMLEKEQRKLDAAQTDTKADERAVKDAERALERARERLERVRGIEPP